jgi:hypothetical protein
MWCQLVSSCLWCGMDHLTARNGYLFAASHVDRLCGPAPVARCRPLRSGTATDLSPIRLSAVRISLNRRNVSFDIFIQFMPRTILLLPTFPLFSSHSCAVLSIFLVALTLPCDSCHSARTRCRLFELLPFLLRTFLVSDRTYTPSSQLPSIRHAVSAHIKAAFFLDSA